jgi:flagellar basal-body rod protein FlgG
MEVALTMMMDGMRISTEAMMNLEEKQAVVANNLANAGTAGYRKEVMETGSFSKVLDHQMKQVGAFDVPGKSSTNELVPGGGGMGISGSFTSSTSTSFSQGALKLTGNKFDMSLDDNGKGFFSVQSKDGIRFTRNGAFRLSTDGYLVTADGSKVLGQKGPIKLDGKDFEIKDNGTITIDGKNVDRFLITEFTTTNTLRKDGESNFIAQDGFKVTNDFSIKQGYLEMANVNAVKEMMDLMQVQKMFEANQKVISAQDQALRKSVNEVGKGG